MFQKSFEGSDQYYLADPKKITIKKNGGKRWGVLKESKLPLSQAIEAHLNGTPVTDEYGSTGIRGIVLPPIRKSDNKCKWGAIDVDGNIYKDNGFKRDLLNKIKDLDLPLLPCFSKSKGIHIYIRFKEWTDAQKVIDILTTILIKLELPLDTEKFPKQAKVDGTGNGVMLPYMHGVGNDWIKKYDEKEFYTGTREEFEEMFDVLDVNAEDIKIELPAEVNTDTNGSTKKSTEYSRFEIIKKIKSMLNLKCEIVLDKPSELTSTDRLIEICKEHGAKTYIAGTGGRKYMDIDKFTDSNLQVEFQSENNMIKKPILEVLKDV